LEVMGSALARDPRAGFAYTDAWILDSARSRVARKTAMSGQRPPNPPPNDRHDFLLELLDRNFVYTSTTIPRRVVTEVGGYDERFRYGEDFELWVRIIESGRHAVRVSGNLAIHRISPSSLTSDLRRYYQGISDVYRTMVIEHDLDPAGRAVAMRRQAWWSRQRALLDDRRPRARLVAAARRAREPLRASRRWLKHPPSVVVETLQSCEPVEGS
jgi:GT2 family glycosyltransferase